MYRLIIADDEDNIREGMTAIVNWQALGFDVARVCSDGDEVIAYLQGGGEADAILTDVRMVNVSGLDLARYVHERHPEIRVVFLSGYREFEYARAAAQYNVRHYLLKPTQLSEIYRVFEEIHQSLDDAQARRQKEARSRQDTRQLFSLYVDQMLAGGLSPDGLMRLTELLSGMGLDASRTPGILMQVVPKGIAAPEADWRNMKGALTHSYAALAEDTAHPLRYLPVLHHRIPLSFIVFGPMVSGGEIEDLVRADFGQIERNAGSLLGMPLSFEIRYAFDSFAAFAQTRPFHYFLQQSGRPDMPQGWNGLLEKSREELSACLAAGEMPQALQVIETVINAICGLSGPARANAFIEWISLLRGQLQSLAGMVIPMPDYTELFRRADPSAQKAWAQAIINSMVRENHDEGRQQGLRVIHAAKAYIDSQCGRNLSLRHVADHVYLSPAYFSRLFKQYTGETVTDYIARVRVEKAKELLRLGMHKVYEVSALVGYPNTKYFFRIFKKVTGQTPYEYGSRLDPVREEKA